MEIGNIVKGTMNEVLGLNKDIAEERLKICYICPLYVSRLGGVCNRKLWLNPITQEISTVLEDGYFRGCGCRCKAKATLSYESCPAGKW